MNLDAFDHQARNDACLALVIASDFVGWSSLENTFATSFVSWNVVFRAAACVGLAALMVEMLDSAARRYLRLL